MLILLNRNKLNSRYGTVERMFICSEFRSRDYNRHTSKLAVARASGEIYCAVQIFAEEVNTRQTVADKISD